MVVGGGGGGGGGIQCLGGGRGGDIRPVVKIYKAYHH